jgi:hypothetical protein
MSNITTYLNRSEIIDLYSALVKTKEKPYNYYRPICTSVIGYLGYMYNDRVSAYMKSIFVSWDGFSGNIDYPVPANFSIFDPSTWYFSKKERAKMKFRYTMNLWTGSYGKRRKELLDFMIVTIEHDIATGEFLDD